RDVRVPRVECQLAAAEPAQAGAPARARRQSQPEAEPRLLIGDGNRTRSFARACRKQILRSRACRALAQDDSAARLRWKKKKRGVTPFPFPGSDDACHPEGRRREGSAFLGRAGARGIPGFRTRSRLRPRESYTVTLVTSSGT